MEVLSSQERTNYPCALTVDDLGDDFALKVQVVRPLSAHRVCRYVQQTLSETVVALERLPYSPAWRVDVLDETERHQLLVEWNQTHRPYPDSRRVHELFEAQVARTPDAVAVVHAGQALSYAELNARSNQLARYLREKGVEPDQLVSICVERGLELIVGLFGILKAGGAYVPLDPTYPSERLAYMLQDAASSLLLTQERLVIDLPETSAEMVFLDQDWSTIATRDRTNLPPHCARSSARDLAYLIYTSGSTGKPKGVMVEHAGVVNCLLGMQEQLNVSATDCMLAVTTVSFDTAGVEIYLPLLSGAKIILVGRDAASDAHQLMAVVEKLDVTFMQATPTTWQMLLAAGWSGRSSLTALCGGEALRTDLSRDLMGRVGALWNLYGPTEVSVWSCLRRITTVPERGAVESIGNAIANTRIYILDSRMRAAPIGVTGEIYIAGTGVARGYLNRPELTTERFVADPFSDGASARMYKTGDLGQWRADGTIEFIGRNDHQVKIRGFRIELGEIETQVARHAHVKAAVVVAREDVPGESRLVAYITQHDQHSLNVHDLRAHLTSALPEYMVPSAFVTLESFPLTPNGKLDRRALPAPDGQAYATREYEAPVGVLETELAQIWSELLSVERIGRHDNFFELGGHSLTDLKLVSRIAQQFDVQIHVQAVYRCPTVQQLAQLVEESLPATHSASACGQAELEEFVL
jgi:amino acid adenylation domain-containing protein